TVSVAFGRITAGQIMTILISCAGATTAAGVVMLARGQVRRRQARLGNGAVAGGAVAGGPGGAALSRAEKDGWRMPPLATLSVPPITAARKFCLTGLWIYVAIAMAAVVIFIVQLATA